MVKINELHGFLNQMTREQLIDVFGDLLPEDVRGVDSSALIAYLFKSYPINQIQEWLDEAAPEFGNVCYCNGKPEAYLFVGFMDNLAYYIDAHMKLHCAAIGKMKFTNIDFSIPNLDRALTALNAVEDSND